MTQWYVALPDNHSASQHLATLDHCCRNCGPVNSVAAAGQEAMVSLSASTSALPPLPRCSMSLAAS